jgi:hypothetical protein
MTSQRNGNGSFFFLPFLILPTAAGILWFTRGEFIFDPPLLLPLLNTVFLAAMPLAVAVLLTRSMAARRAPALLLVGCSLLSLGLGSLLGGWGLLARGPNFTVTLHNLGALLGSVFVFAGSLRGMERAPRRDRSLLRARPLLAAALCYGAIAVFFLGAAHASRNGLFPVFFVQGRGPTLLRQLALAVSVPMYAVAAVYFVRVHGQFRYSFFNWFANGLGLFGAGLFCLLFQKNVGGLVGWLARALQYCAGVYFLAGVIASFRMSRDPALTLPWFLQDIFRGWLDDHVASRTRALADANLELRAVNQFMLTSSRMTDVDVLCRYAVGVVQSLVPRSIVVITLGDPDPRVRAAAGVGGHEKELVGRILAVPGLPGAPHAGSDSLVELPEGVPALCAAAADPEACRSMLADRGIATTLAAPLRSGEKVVGAVLVLLPGGAAAPRRTAGRR